MRTISAFSMQHKISNDFTEITRAKSKAKKGRAYLSGFAFGLSKGLQNFIYAFLFWYVRIQRAGTVTAYRPRTKPLAHAITAADRHNSYV
jgi:hypothetical protein